MFFFKADEGTRHYREGLRYRDPNRQEFDIEKAIQHFKLAIGLKPWVAAYHTDLGHTYLVTPVFAVTRGVKVSFNLAAAARLSIPHLEEGLRLNPKNAWTYCWLGLAYEYLGLKKKAIEAYRPVLDLKGRQWLWVRRSVQVCLDRLEGKTPFTGDASKTKKLILEAIEHRNKGDFKKATEVFEQAVHLAPNSEWLYKVVCEEGAKPTPAT
jgi:tetratricopeptide (TPR) repeat protein